MILLIGHNSFNTKLEIPNVFDKSSLFFRCQNLKSQEFINQQIWTGKQTVEMKAKKLKYSISTLPDRDNSLS